MNASAEARPLILGIGNPLRGDDGLGQVVLSQLARSGDLNCEFRAVHQLTPELAEHMAVASLVLMIDASRERAPGYVSIRQVSPSHSKPGAIGAHHVTPDELALLTAVIYGHCPPVIVVSITGADFLLGERLSPAVTQVLPRVNASIRQIILTSRAA